MNTTIFMACGEALRDKMLLSQSAIITEYLEPAHTATKREYSNSLPYKTLYSASYCHPYKDKEDNYIQNLHKQVLN